MTTDFTVNGTIINVLRNSAIPIYIRSPPEFMPLKPSHLKCEGYWNSIGSKNAYLPIISTKIWIDKELFVRCVYAINRYLIDNGKYFRYRGLSPSRIISNEYVGAGEYEDTEYNMCWPENYIGHYIRDHNVMPTRRFYEYVAMRINTLPPEYKWDIYALDIRNEVSI
ncbi:Hypothetical protein HVR_LOCUS365 [uncultured virus]|nr:Hypothetical protein HVR_LOCUS365 [uncultured virus]